MRSLDQSLFRCGALSRAQQTRKNDHAKDFTMSCVEGRRTRLKDQANMHKVFGLVLLKAVEANFFFFPEDEFFLDFVPTFHLLKRGNNNGLTATSFLHLCCNYLW